VIKKQAKTTSAINRTALFKDEQIDEHVFLFVFRSEPSIEKRFSGVPFGTEHVFLFVFRSERSKKKRFSGVRFGTSMKKTFI